MIPLYTCSASEFGDNVLLSVAILYRYMTNYTINIYDLEDRSVVVGRDIYPDFYHYRGNNSNNNNNYSIFEVYEILKRCTTNV